MNTTPRAHDVVGRERHDRAAGAGVAAEAGHDQMRHGVEDFEHDVVDRVDVTPGFQRRILRGLDHVEMDAVGEEVDAAQKHDDLRRPATREKKGVAQAIALIRAHRAIAEVEVEPDRRFPPRLSDLLKCPIVRLGFDR